MGDLELEKLELEKLELELEIKKKEQARQEVELELKKKQIELKKQELEQHELRAKEEKLEIIEEKEQEEKVEVIEAIADINEEDTDTQALFNEKQILIIFLSIAIIWTTIFVMNKKNTENKKNIEIQKNIEDQKYYDSIPVIIENPERFYDMTYSDIIELYGEPNEKGDFRYNMGDYELEFYFAHGFVRRMDFYREEKYGFKDPNDKIHLFGMEYKDGDVVHKGENGDLVRCSDGSRLNFDFSSSFDITERATIFFEEHYPERLVFEDDFSDTTVLYNLMQYIGMDMVELAKSLGMPDESSQPGGYVQSTSFTFYKDIGKIDFGFNENACVDYVHFYTSEPIKYEKSIQEIMVMFGVDPNMQGIIFDDYNWKSDDYYEKYNYPILVKKSGIIEINNINLKNKTFEDIEIYE